MQAMYLGDQMCEVYGLTLSIIYVMFFIDV